MNGLQKLFAHRSIAAKLSGKDVPAPTVRVPGGGLFSKLGSLFGGRA